MSIPSVTKKTNEDSGSIPAAWPGAFGLYRYSKEVVKRNVWTIVGLYLASFVVSGFLLGMFDKDREHFGLINVLVQLISVIFSTAITVVLLRSIAGKKIAFGESLSEALPYYVNMLITTILLAITAVITLAALVVPFFLVVPRLVLAEYFVIDKNMNPIDALKASWNLTRGNVGKVWGIIGVNILMALLILTVIGIPFAIYLLLMYSAAYVVLYAYLHASEKTA